MQNPTEITETGHEKEGRRSPAFALWIYLIAVACVVALFYLALEQTGGRVTMITALYFLTGAVLFLLVCFLLVRLLKSEEKACTTIRNTELVTLPWRVDAGGDDKR